MIGIPEFPLEFGTQKVYLSTVWHLTLSPAKSGLQEMAHP